MAACFDQAIHFVILSSMDLGSKIKVGRVTLLRSAPGRSCDMICESTLSAIPLSMYMVLSRNMSEQPLTDHCPDLAPRL